MHTHVQNVDDVPLASQTGKKLSPRKIMMDTRDRIEEVGSNIDLNKGVFKNDGKQLIGDYITDEENACKVVTHV